MSDAEGLNAASRSTLPVSSSQDDDRHHYQPVPAATLPEYSQQPIDGIDTRAEVIIHYLSNTKRQFLMSYSDFDFSHYFFVSGPCAGLSWPPRQSESESGQGAMPPPNS